MERMNAVPTKHEPKADGEGGVLCKRCGQLLDSNAVLIIIGDDDIEQFCSIQHAAEHLTSRHAHSR